MFREYNRHMKLPATHFAKFADQCIAFVDNESVLFLMIAAFGLPSFTEADTVTAYYCVVPLVAMVMVAQTFDRVEMPEVEVPAPITNGTAVPVLVRYSFSKC